MLADAPKSIAEIAEGEKLLLRSASLEEQLRDLETDPTVSEKRAFLNRALENTRTEYTESLGRHIGAGPAMLGRSSVDAAVVEGRLGARQALVLFLCRRGEEGLGRSASGAVWELGRCG